MGTTSDTCSPANAAHRISKTRKLTRSERSPKPNVSPTASSKTKWPKLPKKQARGGRTFEKCVHDLLKVSGKKTLNEICDKLCKQPGMKCNKFVLRHVMERLRAKKVVKIYQFRYSATGARLPPKKRGSKK